jgi:penicillin amidase
MLAIVATPYLLGLSAGGMFRIGPMLDPVDGLYRTARLADADPPSLAAVAGLGGPVEVAWDGRGVPHIFAENDLDAIRATGYVTAHDRLFQMDFLRRFTSGRLAEVFGPSALSTDRSMRRTGIEAAVRMNVEAARDEDRPTYELFAAFADGVNAYLSGVEERDLPFEFRLFGYRPEPFTALDPGLIGWNLLYDLTFRGTPTVDDAAVDSLLGPGVGDLLFPRDNPLSRPIVPAEEAHWRTGVDRSGAGGFAARIPWTGDERWTESFADLAAGLVEGKGSNNWAVGPRRSATGAPILAGDMHLALWLPSIWYELHVVTPTMDSYGVTVPGVPLPIEAFNRSVGWAFTNTGADQVDHLLLVEDSTGRRYRYDDGWRDFRFEVDTLLVRGGDSVVDTVRWTHWGPVVHRQGREIAIRWVAHDTLRTFDALLAMNRARGYDEFEQAIRFWDAPMQNILVADTAGTIAIRSTGHLPIRRDGGGAGYRDGSSPGSEWVGRVPFDDLPHVVDPSRGYLTSTNQQPTDGSYPWYMGRDWRSTYRSIRIDTLLSGRDRHDPGQIASFQADVHAVQRDWFVPLLGAAGAVSARAGRLRAMLEAWSGETGVERPEPLVMDVFLGVLDDLVWDEPGFARIRRPTGVVLYRLLTGALEGPWLDRVGTERVETGRDVLAEALELAADSIEAAYGPDPDGWAWGRHHRLILRHVSQTPALRALWRGPVPFPGFESTLSPGAGRTVTHGASWRVVVDFSGERPAGRGIYAGGPSGNPFSRRYDAYVDDFVGFRLNELQTPESPDMLPVRTRLLPDPTYPMPPAP